MLYALLFNGQDQLIAAAPAMLHHAAGDRYWRDSFSRPLPLNPDCQTAYVEIADDQLRQWLDSLETDDQLLQACRARVEDLILSGDGPESGGTSRTRAA